MAEQTFSPTDAQRPFPGLRSFQESNKEQFGGREQEISDLMNLCDQGILTLVFGQSGIGKTSLLQAGLMPRLQKSLNIPVLIRIDYSSTKSPLEQVKNILYEKLKPVFPSLHPVGDRSLWRYFHEEALEDGLLIPVLIFDQFEEVFTLGKKKAADVREFITELSDLAENRIPFRDQQAFRNELSTSISHFSNHPYRIIISLREDFLAQMEGLKTEMPSLLIQRYRVLRMNVLQAMDAAMRPAQGLINKEIARELISRIPGVKPEDFSSEEHNLRPVVEPFLLSLLCYQMNEERIRKGAQVFTSELVQQFNVANAIEDYYRQVMEQFPSSISDSIENELLTEGGFRKLETLELMQNQYGWNEAVVQQLTDLRIIRKEERDGVQYIELIHDVLTPTIKSRRDQRVMRQMEKTKSEEIRRAIDLDRRRSRKRFQTVFISAVLLLVSVG
ncbi:MAG TPA: hypothetical protein PLP14_08155, partial [Chitinophagaceae bacterium]|nr:hypothetical protein [Chitinophagaceae bacterium]